MQTFHRQFTEHTVISVYCTLCLMQCSPAIGLFWQSSESDSSFTGSCLGSSRLQRVISTHFYRVTKLRTYNFLSCATCKDWFSFFFNIIIHFFVFWAELDSSNLFRDVPLDSPVWHQCRAVLQAITHNRGKTRVYRSVPLIQFSQYPIISTSLDAGGYSDYLLHIYSLMKHNDYVNQVVRCCLFHILDLLGDW